MPLLGFSKLKEKLLDGSKTQTIRKPRKHPLKVGDKLYIYWKIRTKDREKLGEAVVTKIKYKQLANINEEDAVNDGFLNLRNFLELFRMMHPKSNLMTFFAIITFRWTLKLWEKEA